MKKEKKVKTAKIERKFWSRQRKVFTIGILFLLVSAIIIGFIILKKRTVIDGTEVKAGAGEIIEYAKITLINGNDIDVDLVEEKKMTDSTENGQNENGAAGSDSESDTANKRGGSMPSDGEMPSGMSMPSGGDMPSGMGMPSGGEMPSDMTSAMQSGSSQNSFKQNMTTYEATGETASYQIPVGTTVITKLGAETTFTHLDEEDIIAILKDEKSDTILKIWIIA